MKIHCFQRCHAKENVATANTMLLLSRLYNYSTNKFYQLLKNLFFANSFNPELNFTIQEKSEKSVPDAIICQNSFKLVVETKMTDCFGVEQLKNHLAAFSDEQHKVLLTIAGQKMNRNTYSDFQKELDIYNETQKVPVLHFNTTFEDLATAVSEVLSDQDFEMQEVLNDYLDYCYHDKLITSDDWKYMRMQLASTTLEYNMSANVYYDSADRGFRPHNYLGLYKDKSVRAIGKIDAILRAVVKDGKLEVVPESEDFFVDSADPKKVEEAIKGFSERIAKAMEDGKRFGYDLENTEHRYFFVEKFYETDFRKITPRAPMGTRIFDLSDIVGISSRYEDVSKIAEELKTKTWE